MPSPTLRQSPRSRLLPGEPETLAWAGIPPSFSLTLSGSERLAAVLPWLAGPLLFGLFALCLGQDANWDLRNYHLYNPYAFLHQRLDYDAVPAQVANFYNPLLYIPYYFAVTSLPPLVVAFLLGAAQGLNLPLLINIARNAMGREKSRDWWLYFLIALVGLLGAGNISELGTMFADNLVSLLVLAGIWLLLAHYRLLTTGRLRQGLLVAGAGGLLFGLAAGLKQPAATFAVGWCAAFLVLPVPPRRRIGLAFFFGLGVLGGIAVGGGYWMYELWTRYGNPLFPYFNQFFASPMASMADYRDARFLPRNLWETLFFPFVIAWDPRHTAEIPFRDLRFPLFAVLLAAAGLVALYKRLMRTNNHDVMPGKQSATRNPLLFLISAAPGPHAVSAPRKRLFLLCGALVAYAAWLRLFGIYRYLLPLEMLAPLGIWLLIAAFPWQKVTKYWLALCCALLLLVTLQPGNWGRVSWGGDFFGVHPPPLADPDHTMVLMTGLAPLSYVIPFFPEQVRFVRIQSYFTEPVAGANGFNLRMQQLVANHQGPLYVLYHFDEKEQATTALRAYGLDIDGGDCRELSPHIEEQLDAPLSFCAAKRTDSFNTRGENR